MGRQTPLAVAVLVLAATIGGCGSPDADGADRGDAASSPVDVDQLDEDVDRLRLAVREMSLLWSEEVCEQRLEDGALDEHRERLTGHDDDRVQVLADRVLTTVSKAVFACAEGNGKQAEDRMSGYDTELQRLQQRVDDLRAGSV